MNVGKEYFCQILFFTIRCTMLRGSADGPSDLLVWHYKEFGSKLTNGIY